MIFIQGIIIDYIDIMKTKSYLSLHNFNCVNVLSCAEFQTIGEIYIKMINYNYVNPVTTPT